MSSNLRYAQQLSNKLTQHNFTNSIHSYEWFNSNYPGVQINIASDHVLPQGAIIRIIFLDGGMLHFTSFFKEIQNYELSTYLNKVNNLNVHYWGTMHSFYIINNTQIHSKIIMTDINFSQAFDALTGLFVFLSEAYNKLTII